MARSITTPWIKEWLLSFINNENASQVLTGSVQVIQTVPNMLLSDKQYYMRCELTMDAVSEFRTQNDGVDVDDLKGGIIVPSKCTLSFDTQSFVIEVRSFDFIGGTGSSVFENPQDVMSDMVVARLHRQMILADVDASKLTRVMDCFNRVPQAPNASENVKRSHFFEKLSVVGAASLMCASHQAIFSELWSGRNDNSCVANGVEDCSQMVDAQQVDGVRVSESSPEKNSGLNVSIEPIQRTYTPSLDEENKSSADLPTLSPPNFVEEYNVPASSSEVPVGRDQNGRPTAHAPNGTLSDEDDMFQYAGNDPEFQSSSPQLPQSPLHVSMDKKHSMDDATLTPPPYPFDEEDDDDDDEMVQEHRKDEEAERIVIPPTFYETPAKHHGYVAESPLKLTNVTQVNTQEYMEIEEMARLLHDSEPQQSPPEELTPMRISQNHVSASSTSGSSVPATPHVPLAQKDKASSSPPKSSQDRNEVPQEVACSSQHQNAPSPPLPVVRKRKGTPKTSFEMCLEMVRKRYKTPPVTPKTWLDILPS